MTTTAESTPAAVSPAQTRQEGRDRQWALRLEAAVAGAPGASAWLRTQRRVQRLGNLSAGRKAALDQQLPGWALGPQDRWLETASDLVDYEDLNGALPTASGIAEARRLWRWLTYQRDRHAAGKLANGRRKWLDKKLPGWMGEMAGHGG